MERQIVFLKRITYEEIRFKKGVNQCLTTDLVEKIDRVHREMNEINFEKTAIELE